MIRFIKLLFYHIYLYFYKVDDGNKALAKFTTWLIFTLIFGIIVYFGYTSFRLTLDKSPDYTKSNEIYIIIYVIIGLYVGKVVFFEGFEKLDTFKNYNIKYYIYFFIICIIAFALAFYSISVNQKRILNSKKVENHGKSAF
ncbi:hypothetical protein [Chryseobacterium sp. G0201]|uniref:hypothetical protein n=1 Tax=Chryseobacterium sp. G0201 TaxID=2487065 RepID=UPI0013DE686F|nr:hypothetical protein [Chryseobacterium sp. G0201]